MGSSSLHNTKVMMGLEEKNEVDKACEAMCVKLTMKQRVMGYAMCFGVGSLLNLFSWTTLRKMWEDPPDPTPFVVLFIFGNIVQLASGCFFSGPVAYGKKLLSAEMRCAAFFYFTAMICLIVVAFQPTITGENDEGDNECSSGDDCVLEPEGLVGLVVMMLIVCYICMAWFVICSIPFGKRIACSCIEKSCDKCGGKQCRERYEKCCKKKKKPMTTSMTATRRSSGSNSSNSKKPAASAGTMSSLLPGAKKDPPKNSTSGSGAGSGGSMSLFRSSGGGGGGGGSGSAKGKEQPQPDPEAGMGLMSMFRKKAPEPEPEPEPEPAKPGKKSVGFFSLMRGSDNAV